MKFKNKVYALLFGILIIISNSGFGQTSLDLDKFVNKIKATPQAQLLDVRTPGEWSQGKLAKSNLINYNDPSFTSSLSKLDKNKPVFVYCAVGGRSAKASQVLKEQGFKEIYNLTGAGYPQLSASGLK